MPKKQRSKARTLHVMYFVDSQSSRSFSLNLRTLKLFGFLVSLLTLLSLMGNVLLAFSFQQLVASESSLQKVKAAHLAQAIAHENLFREAPYVVASSDMMLLSRETKKIAESLESRQPIPAEANDFEGASDLSMLENADDPDPPEEADSTLDSGEPRVKLERFSFAFDPGENSLSLNFDLRNIIAFGTKMKAKVCAIVEGISATGEAITRTFPADLSVQPESEQTCTGGLPLHFARVKPTQLVLKTDQFEVTGVRILYTDSEGTQSLDLLVSD